MALIPFRGRWDIDRWFDDDAWPEWPSMKLVKMPDAPKIDVYEKDDEVKIKAELPGFKSDQISAKISDGMLVIEGNREEKTEEEDKDKKYWKKEISRGYVKRIVALPVDVQEDKAQASFKDGILRISVPKAASRLEEEKIKKIEIKNE
ncbi:MAG: Hsp20/alpha crystallin family protein [Candidatus Pacebacteria bacterium]|jgi:HSP20 family protein|nr:Hsp20/alpha crystallin family protein [Candidatus Paceibacterota bacterium]